MRLNIRSVRRIFLIFKYHLTARKLFSARPLLAKGWAKIVPVKIKQYLNVTKHYGCSNVSAIDCKKPGARRHLIYNRQKENTEVKIKAKQTDP